MLNLFIFPFEQYAWYQALISLSAHVTASQQEEARATFLLLFRELIKAGHADLVSAFCDAFAYTETSIDAELMRGELSKGLEPAILADLNHCKVLATSPWQQLVSDLAEQNLPALEFLAPANKTLETLGKSFVSEHPEVFWQGLKARYMSHGTGSLARYKAFAFHGGELQGVRRVKHANPMQLFGLDKQLKMLADNTEAFLQGFQAQHCLLYGPRGSGKSTAVRSLLSPYAEQGLRLIELSQDDLGHLGDLSNLVRHRPHKYLLFVDDLSFEQGDTSYHPLKSMLEGSVSEKASNVLIYATSNRRHLVKEQFSDRPDPLNDDVHGWDSQHEKLALSDRFGLTITFPSPSQSRYLEIVMGLAQLEGLKDSTLRERAIRFADWGNGYSGRTAQQFIDSARAGLA